MSRRRPNKKVKQAPPPEGLRAQADYMLTSLTNHQTWQHLSPHARELGFVDAWKRAWGQ